MSLVADILTLPRAYGSAPGLAQLRSMPEDFIVKEWLGFGADGAGEHWLLTIRKRGANTLWVAKQLARIGRIHPRDVGFAGLKDRDAVAEQAFTVPVHSAIGDWMGAGGEGFEVIAAARHRRKLKRGALRGNEFQLVLRNFSGDLAALQERLRTIATAGVPNYFGPQRFGRDGQNLRAALAWFESGTEPPERFERGFALSAARAAIFNAVLARRVGDGTWNTLLAGDVANLDGSGSIFAVPSVDEMLAERCRTLDIHPTGPMWNGTTIATDAAAAIEASVVAEHPMLAAGLSRAGLEGERRALRMRVDQLGWAIESANESPGESSGVRLRFRLPRGAFATAVLHELLENAFSQATPEADT